MKLLKLPLQLVIILILYWVNVIIFGVYMSSSVHIDNKKEDNFILAEGPRQGLAGTTLTAEKSI